MKSSHILQVEGLNRSFGTKQAVKNIHFQLQAGEVVGLLGANGAGKSTTLRLITGFLRPDSGHILWGDDPITESNSLDFQKRLGYLPESAAIYPDLTISEYLRNMAGIRGIPREEIPQAVLKVVDACDLNSHYHTLIGSLSKGYRQRVAFAATILHDPDILILDEPTSGLDPNQIQDIRNLIKEFGKTKIVLFSSHILQEIEELCQKVIVISQGSVVANSLVSEIKKNSKIEFETNADPDTVEALLENHLLSAPHLVRSQPNWFTYWVDLPHSQPETLFEIFKTSDYQLRSLHTLERSLETIFRELTLPTKDTQ